MAIIAAVLAVGLLAVAGVLLGMARMGWQLVGVAERQVTSRLGPTAALGASIGITRLLGRVLGRFALPVLAWAALTALIAVGLLALTWDAPVSPVGLLLGVGAVFLTAVVLPRALQTAARRRLGRALTRRRR